MQTMVKATFTIIDDDEKAKRTEVIEMVYPMDEDRNFLKSLIEYLEDEEVTLGFVVKVIDNVVVDNNIIDLGTVTLTQ